jgi:hypothetical protein
MRLELRVFDSGVLCLSHLGFMAGHMRALAASSRRVVSSYSSSTDGCNGMRYMMHVCWVQYARGGYNTWHDHDRTLQR